MKKITNPNGYNQHKPDPRQSLFLSYYFDPKSETFSNALQSALKAGYEQEYAESLTSKMPTWLAEKVGDEYLIKTAEKNLKEFLEMDTTNTSKAGDKVISITDTQLVKIKQDTTKFVLERLHKKKYSTKIEVDNKGEVKHSFEEEQIDRIADRIASRKRSDGHTPVTKESD